jgi:hypothetical protein
MAVMRSRNKPVAIGLSETCAGGNRTRGVRTPGRWRDLQNLDLLLHCGGQIGLMFLPAAKKQAVKQALSHAKITWKTAS